MKSGPVFPRQSSTSLRPVVGDLRILFPVLLSLFWGNGCAVTPDFSPLTDSDSGFVRIAWHDGIESVRKRLEQLPGVRYKGDTTIVIQEEPLYISADSVVPPRLGTLMFRRSDFKGGLFFGFRVDEWQAWFSPDGKLRNIDVIFEADHPPDVLFASISERMMGLYGVPDERSAVYQKFSFRSWLERSLGGEIPGTGALLTWVRVPGKTSLGFHDYAYADSLEAVPFQDPVALSEWNRLKSTKPR